MDERVVAAIRRLATDPDVLAGAAEKLEAALYEEESGLAQHQQDLLSRLEKVQLDSKRWLERYNNNEIDRDEFEILRDAQRSERERLKAELADVQQRAENRTDREARLQLALRMLRKFSIWDSMDVYERRALASYVIQELVFHPQDRLVEVHLRLILSEPEVFQAPIRGRGGRKSTGLSSLSATELTTAYYLAQGCEEKEIASKRNVSADTIYMHKRRLLKCVGAADLPEALKMVAPIVESRKDELLLDKDRSRSFRDRFSNHEIKILKLLAQGKTKREIGKSTERSAATIAKQVQRIYEKLCVHTAREAIRKAQARHLIEGSSVWSERPTPKQMAVLKGLGAGCSQLAAAKRLRITYAALKERVKCMFRKFGVNRISDLLVLARERGWLED